MSYLRVLTTTMSFNNYVTVTFRNLLRMEINLTKIKLLNI
jgi:hypothetical protein